MRLKGKPPGGAPSLSYVGTPDGSLVGSAQRPTGMILSLPGQVGAPGEDGVSLNWRGNWDNMTAYNTNDLVEWYGTVYICLNDLVVVQPDLSPTNWTIFAAKGAQGDTGDKGDKGDKGDTGDTGPPGTTTWAGITDKPSTFTPSAHTHTVANITDLSLDTVPVGTTNKAFTQTEKTKLAGIASGATANDTDANLKSRANHTGTQPSSTISDFTSAVDARVNAGITAFVGAAPAALDTLDELAAALGDDPNFATTVTTNLGDKADKATTISAGTGLTGGGSLAANRTLSVSYGTTAGTACQGNDSRLSDARTPTAHTHVAANITDLSKTSVGLGNVDNTSDATKWAATKTLTNTTMSGANNTFSNIPESAITNLETDLANKVNGKSIQAQGYSASAEYRLLADLPIDNSGNYSSVTINGRLGGWVNDNLANWSIVLTNRSDYSGNNVSAGVVATGGDTAALAALDLVVYKQADLSAKLYLKMPAGSYWTYDFSISSLQATVSYTGGTVTPTGTQIWALSGSDRISNSNKVVGSNNGTPTKLTLWTGTTAQYAAIGTKDANTVYVVTA